MRYQKYCDEVKLDGSLVLETSLYKRSLEETLNELAYEDMKEHGRLLVLKELLVKLIGFHDKPDIKTLALFQLKDICRCDAEMDESMKKDIRAVKITSKEAIRAMDYRQANMIYPKAKLVQEGGENIDDDIDGMREAILKKEGIVSKEAEQDFHFFVKNCMSRQLLDQIGGEMNSFSKNSFRLNQLNASGKGFAGRLHSAEGRKTPSLGHHISERSEL